MELTEKECLKNLRSILPVMLEKTGLKPLIPHVHIRISNNLPAYAAAKISKLGTSYIITASEALSPDMQIVALAHEIAHLKIEHSGWLMNFGEFIFHILFRFIKIENEFRHFGDELFVVTVVAPRILKPIAPALLPMQTARRKKFIEKRAPSCLKKIICIFSDLLVLLTHRQGRFFIGITIHIIYGD